MKTKPVIVESVPVVSYLSEDGKRAFTKITAYRRTARFRIKLMRPCSGHSDEVDLGYSVWTPCSGRCFWTADRYDEIVERYARMLMLKNKKINLDQKTIKGLLKINDNTYFARKKNK